VTDSDGGFDRDDGEADGPEDIDPDLFDVGDPASQPVEPGSPTLENAAFVLLGVASMIALIYHLVSLL
jgi:hypothetical protein